MGANRDESLTEYLERIYQIPDTRPCKEHRFEIDTQGILRCLYCQEPYQKPHAKTE